MPQQDNKEIFFRLTLNDHPEEDVIESYTSDGRGPRYVDRGEMTAAQEIGFPVVTIPMRKFHSLADQGYERAKREFNQLGIMKNITSEDIAKFSEFYQDKIAHCIGKNDIVYNQNDIPKYLGALCFIGRAIEKEVAVYDERELKRPFQNRYDVFGVSLTDGGREKVRPSATVLQALSFIEHQTANYVGKGYDYLIAVPEDDAKNTVMMKQPAQTVSSLKVSDFSSQRGVYSRVGSVLNGSHVEWDKDFNGRDYNSMLDSFEEHVPRKFNQVEAFYYMMSPALEDGDAEIMSRNGKGILVYDHNMGEYQYYARFSKQEAIDNVNENGLSPFASDDIKLIVAELREAENVAIYQNAVNKPSVTLTEDQLAGLENSSFGKLVNNHGRIFKVDIGDGQEHTLTIGGLTSDRSGARALAFFDGAYSSRSGQMVEISFDSFMVMSRAYADKLQLEASYANDNKGQLQYMAMPEKRYTNEEMLADNKLSDGRVVDRTIFYKDHDEKSKDYGHWRIYTQVGEQKMSRNISDEDLYMYFDRKTTPTKLVEKNFGEQLHLASFYNQFRLPKNVDVEVRIAKTVNGEWTVRAVLPDGRETASHSLTWNDKQALFCSKTCTREQLAARYCNEEIKALTKDVKQERKASVGKTL